MSQYTIPSAMEALKALPATVAPLLGDAEPERIPPSEMENAHKGTSISAAGEVHVGRASKKRVLFND